LAIGCDQKIDDVYEVLVVRDWCRFFGFDIEVCSAPEIELRFAVAGRWLGERGGETGVLEASGDRADFELGVEGAFALEVDAIGGC
jgi:hypothetical protein